MADDIELLPLPDWMECMGQVSAHQIRDYALACVANVTTAQDTEIEALRKDAERMAEALRLYLAAGFGNSTDFYKQAEAKRAAQLALDPTAAQENDRG